jgi:hypothetical protein
MQKSNIVAVSVSLGTSRLNIVSRLMNAGACPEQLFLGLAAYCMMILS